MSLTQIPRAWAWEGGVALCPRYSKFLKLSQEATNGLPHVGVCVRREQPACVAEMVTGVTCSGRDFGQTW